MMRFYKLDNGEVGASDDAITAPAGAAEITEQAYAQGVQTQVLTPALALAKQVGALVTTYETAISQPVSFTTIAGVKQTYQTDPVSRQKMADMLNAYEHTGAVPVGFYWVAADNTQVPFTLADLQGLATEVGAQGWAAFQALQAGKKALGAA